MGKKSIKAFYIIAFSHLSDWLHSASNLLQTAVRMTGSMFGVNYASCIYRLSGDDFWVMSEEPRNDVGGTPEMMSEEPPWKPVQPLVGVVFRAP